MRKEPGRLVFVDETSVKTNMCRSRGRSLRGERLKADAPFGKWRTQTFIAGLRCDSLIAPWVVNGAMDGAAFAAWIETQLAPTLNKGDVVILDNLNTHKSERAADALAARGAWFLFLPKYSPDLNRSRWRSRSSRRICERPSLEPTTLSGKPSATSANSSPPKNAGTSSKPKTMSQIKRPRL